jgi:hypothetical protein
MERWDGYKWERRRRKMYGGDMPRASMGVEHLRDY